MVDGKKKHARQEEWLGINGSEGVGINGRSKVHFTYGNFIELLVWKITNFDPGLSVHKNGLL